MTVHIYNPELFSENGRFILQWLERRDDKTWVRRRGTVSQAMANRIKRMDPFEILQWIAKQLPEPVTSEQPEPEETRTRMTQKDYR